MIQMFGQEILLAISILQNAFFGATSEVKNSDIEKYVYSGCEIIFGSAGSWSCNNDTARNVIILWC